MKMKNLQSYIFSICIVLIIETTWVYAQIQSDLKFKVSFQEGQYSKPQDGRLLLLLADNNEKEPRFQILDGPETQLAFGIDVENLKPGEWILFDDTVFGYPIKNIPSIPSGEYWVQGLFHIYETFHRADGHIVKLPMDRGDGKHLPLR